MDKLRAAVIGVGYFGRFHAQKFAALDCVDLVAVIDQDAERAREVGADLDVPALTDFRQILDQVDLVSIVVPTEMHYPIALECLQAGVHILVEKPVTQTLEQALHLIEVAESRKLVFQVGHLERYNPALVAMRDALSEPVFIESYRLAPFKPRSTGVCVVQDLMTHDIDILLSLIPSKVRNIKAVGRTLLTNEIDFATAYLEFENGCVARVTASRANPDTMRRLQVYQTDSYLSVDYAAHKFLRCHREAGETLSSEIAFVEHSYDQADNLLSEIRAFTDAVRFGRPPAVSGHDGLNALEVALEIGKTIKQCEEEISREALFDVIRNSDHRPEKTILFS